jgi:hypothetical protein
MCIHTGSFKKDASALIIVITEIHEKYHYVWSHSSQQSQENMLSLMVTSWNRYEEDSVITK